jgi:hypothetical protein
MPEASLGNKANARDPSFFKTTTIDLAAWLMTKGIPLGGCENTKFPAFFVFECLRDDVKVKELKKDYEAGKAEGNIRIFYYNLKVLQNMIHNGRM